MAQPGCKVAPAALPSSETRVVRNAQFGFKFSIPANYRTIIKTDRYDFGNVTLIFVLNPSELNFLECLRKAGEPSEISYESVVAIRPISAQGLDIFGHVKEILKQDSPRFRQTLISSGLSTGIDSGKVAQRPTAFYHSVGMYTTRNAAFLAPSRNQVFSVGVAYNTDAEGRVTKMPQARANLFQQILDTFSFESD